MACHTQRHKHMRRSKVTDRALEEKKIILYMFPKEKTIVPFTYAAYCRTLFSLSLSPFTLILLCALSPVTLSLHFFLRPHRPLGERYPLLYPLDVYKTECSLQQTSKQNTKTEAKPFKTTLTEKINKLCAFFARCWDPIMRGWIVIFFFKGMINECFNMPDQKFAQRHTYQPSPPLIK